MPRDTLQFAHSSRPPASDVRVFADLEREFLDTAFTFRVVGNSHFVGAPEYDFYELSSCEPVDATAVTTVPLDPAGPSRRFDFDNDVLSCQTVVEPRPLAAFPGDRSFDLRYDFDEDAATTIDVSEAAFETYHTYPEFDLAVYSRTAFTTVPGDGGRSVAVGSHRATD